jgi:hypothetical protein
MPEGEIEAFGRVIRPRSPDRGAARQSPRTASATARTSRSRSCLCGADWCGRALCRRHGGRHDGARGDGQGDRRGTSGRDHVRPHKACSATARARARSPPVRGAAPHRSPAEVLSIPERETGSGLTVGVRTSPRSGMVQASRGDRDGRGQICAACAEYAGSAPTWHSFPAPRGGGDWVTGPSRCSLGWNSQSSCGEQPAPGRTSSTRTFPG